MYARFLIFAEVNLHFPNYVYDDYKRFAKLIEPIYTSKLCNLIILLDLNCKSLISLPLMIRK